MKTSKSNHTQNARQTQKAIRRYSNKRIDSQPAPQRKPDKTALPLTKQDEKETLLIDVNKAVNNIFEYTKRIKQEGIKLGREMTCKNCELNKDIIKYIKDAKQQERERVLKIIDELCLDCPIQKDEECWCKPLEILKQKISENGE